MKFIDYRIIINFLYEYFELFSESCGGSEAAQEIIDSLEEAEKEN